MAKAPRKYLILDTETATLPFANEVATNPIEKRTIAIAKPLVYDIGWQIVDRNGKVYSKHAYLVSEIFAVPQVFNTAYYAEKRPKYLDRLKANETSIKSWNEIMEILQEDLDTVDYVGAFNSMFDFKKAIPFTEQYIENLYSPDYFKWERRQKWACEQMLKSKQKNDDKEKWDKMHFNFRGQDYKMIDLWGIACSMLINTVTYKRKCLQHGMITETGQFFKTSAETTFRYLCQKYEFVEEHMAIDDVEIECQILQKALKKGKIAEGLDYFPFQKLGKTTQFILKDSKKKIPLDEVAAVIEKIKAKLPQYEVESTFATTLEREMYALIEYLNKQYAEQHQYIKDGYELRMREIVRQGNKLKTKKMNLKKESAIEKCEEQIQELRNEYRELAGKVKELKLQQV